MNSTIHTIKAAWDKESREDVQYQFRITCCSHPPAPPSYSCVFDNKVYLFSSVQFLSYEERMSVEARSDEERLHGHPYPPSSYSITSSFLRKIITGKCMTGVTHSMWAYFPMASPPRIPLRNSEASLGMSTSDFK